MCMLTSPDDMQQHCCNSTGGMETIQANCALQMFYSVVNTNYNKAMTFFQMEHSTNWFLSFHWPLPVWPAFLVQFN